MATPFTAAQINDLPEKALIYKVQGVLKTIWEPHTGTNSRGAYSIQKGSILIDGVEVGIFLKDREEIPKSAKGKIIVFETNNGAKGHTGVYTMDDEYKGEKKRLINVTASGLMSYLDPSEEPKQPPAKPQQQQPHDAYEEAEPHREPAREPAAARDPMKDMLAAIAEADDYATQIANLQLLCLIKVDHYIAPRFQEKTGKMLSETERASLAMNMIIEMQRNGMARKLPRQEARSKPAAQ